MGFSESEEGVGWEMMRGATWGDAKGEKDRTGEAFDSSGVPICPEAGAMAARGDCIDLESTSVKSRIVEWSGEEDSGGVGVSVV